MRPSLLLPAALAPALVALAGCAATSPDTANPVVCRTVEQNTGTLLDQLRAAPQASPALSSTLATLDRALEVRDSDTSDQMRGDALVLQLNVRTAQSELADRGSTSLSRMRQALATFRSRECT